MIASDDEYQSYTRSLALKRLIPIKFVDGALLQQKQLKFTI